MDELFLISGMALVTLAIRYLVLALSGRLKLAPWFLQLLRYVPPVVLTAIVAPAVLMPDNQLELSYTNPRLIGAVAAILVAVWRQNLLLTIVIGMLVFFAWQWLV
jgi:branched-subunit amino acid transport protein